MCEPAQIWIFAVSVICHQSNFLSASEYLTNTNIWKHKYCDAQNNLGSPDLPLQTVLWRPVVLLLANKACHIKVHTHGQILVTLHVLPASLKHVYAVAEKFTHALAGSPPQTVILSDYSLKSDHCSWGCTTNSSVNKHTTGSCVQAHTCQETTPPNITYAIQYIKCSFVILLV